MLKNDLLCLFHGSVFSVNLQANLNVDYVAKIHVMVSLRVNICVADTVKHTNTV